MRTSDIMNVIVIMLSGIVIILLLNTINMLNIGAGINNSTVTVIQHQQQVISPTTQQINIMTSLRQSICLENTQLKTAKYIYTKADYQMHVDAINKQLNANMNQYYIASSGADFNINDCDKPVTQMPQYDNTPVSNNVVNTDISQNNTQGFDNNPLTIISSIFPVMLLAAIGGLAITYLLYPSCY